MNRRIKRSWKSGAWNTTTATGAWGIEQMTGTEPLACLSLMLPDGKAATVALSPLDVHELHLTLFQILTNPQETR